ncbi:TonB-dependent receptor [soil metagenome]
MSISPIALRSGLLAAVSMAAICCAAPALAQTSPADHPAAGASQLDEIVVTARRREERAQDVPIALTVIGGEQLDKSNTYNVGQLTQQAPSVQVLSSNPRNTSITIRGIGASYGLANDGLEQGVGIYVDQVYYARPATATLDFVDLAQIEILRGPQGTLFGKNTTAGALNITTRDASFTPGGTAEISVGDLGFIQAKASVTGPLIGDTLAGRLSLVSTRRDGALDNVRIGRDQNDQHSFAVRGQLLWTPTEKLTVRAYGDWNRQLLECCAQVYVGVGETAKPLLQRYATLVAARPDALPPSTNPYDRLVDVDGDIQADQWQAGGSVIIDYDLGNLLFTSISAYREWDWEPANDRDYTGLDILPKSNNPSHQDQTSQEFRLSSKGNNRIDWVTGLYYFNQTVETHGITSYGKDASYWLLGCAPDPLRPTTNCLPTPLLPAALLDGYTALNTSSIETTSYAAFGQFTWNVTDRLKITPGLRYTYEKKDGDYDLSVFGGATPANTNENNRRLGLQRPQNYSAHISEDSVSGQLAVSYELRPNALAYVSYARGNKSGGLNMTGLPLLADNSPALDRAAVKPEQVSTYELGLKTQTFNRRLTANLAAYYTEIADFQANVVDAAGPGAIRGYISNIEKVEIKGVELDLNAHPNSAIDLYANVSWTDGEYTSFANGPCPLELIGASTAKCDLSGKDLPGVSPWAVSVGGELHGQGSVLGLTGEVFVGADANYRSTYNSDAAVSKYTEIDGYGVLNLRAGFRSDAGWDASVWVKNALDKDYLQFVSVQTGNSGLILGNPGDERTVGFTLRATY